MKVGDPIILYSFVPKDPFAERMTAYGLDKKPPFIYYRRDLDIRLQVEQGIDKEHFVVRYLGMTFPVKCECHPQWW